MLINIWNQTSKQIEFTLLELITVVAIIGILSPIAIPRYHAYTRNASVQAILAEAGSYIKAIEFYLALNQYDNC